MRFSEIIASNVVKETTSAGNVATGNALPYKKRQAKVKSVDALNQNSVSLFGGPMENIKAPIIKRR